MVKRWLEEESADKELVKRLSDELHINKHLTNLLAQRGISTYDEAKTFFRPSLRSLHDPFLLKDMDKAVDRIIEAMQNRERILVYGDYDVDGTTAVALIYLFLRRMSADVDYYIPDRYSEGYGISLQGIEYAHEHGFSLIIALDCGIKAVEKVKEAQKRDIDFIICDHHRPGEELPPAVAVLDPKRTDCEYPYKELSGCGVGFKLIQAFSLRNNIPFRDLVQYLDLVVVSIASDIVPITGENRVLAYFGLQQLNQNPSPGIGAILDIVAASLPKQVLSPDDEPVPPKVLTISDLVFTVGPRINAAGRMESGRNSVALLVCKNHEQASQRAAVIDDYNEERRNLDTQITQEAIEMIRSAGPKELDKKCTLLYNPEWHKGVIGIVASRLTEEFYRPTIIFCEANGLITGSARSVKDFDVYDAVDACSDLLEHFGGHKYAAGLSLKPENLEAFFQRFEQIVAQTIEDDMLIPEVVINETLHLTDITPKFYKILRQFAPFGPGNPAPVFKTECIVDTGYSKIVGKNHLKLSIVHPYISSFPFSGIAFNQGDKFELIQSGQPFDLCYYIEENVWNGKTSLQLHVKDIRPHQPTTTETL
ncbi:MAG: single-stranded-DNA-specific exonuclease RecJ [Bacteroidales bacterium]|nr:single-stranded-DNA-specific exonuclease RecJ [Bacteroidales bacterium]